MKIGKGKKPSFYKTRLKEFIKYLKQLNNEKITELIREEELLSKRFIIKFTYEWAYFGKEITSMLNLLFTMYMRNNFAYEYIKKIALIILLDESISNKDFLTFLYKKEIALILGDVLNKFHESCYEEALQKKSFKDLKQVFEFRYTTNTFKRKVANSIFKLLVNSKNQKVELLNEWYFQTIPLNKKIDYLKSLKFNKNISEKEYLDLFKLYARLYSSSKVKLYIYNILYEKNVLQKNIELQKIAFADNVTGATYGFKFFRLLYDNAKKRGDIKTIKWIYSIYPLKDEYHNIKCIGRKEVANFLSLPLYEE